MHLMPLAMIVSYGTSVFAQHIHKLALKQYSSEERERERENFRLDR